MPLTLSLEVAARIFESDLHVLCDSQLAQVLVNARNLGAHPIAETLAPLAGAELARRRAMNPPIPNSLPEDFQTSRS